MRRLSKNFTEAVKSTDEFSCREVLAGRASHGRDLHRSAACSREGDAMQRDELMKADLLSEVVLLGSGLMILMALLMVLVAAIAGGPAA